MEDSDFLGIDSSGYYHYRISDKITSESTRYNTFTRNSDSDYNTFTRNSDSDYESYYSCQVSNEVVLSYIRSVFDDLDLWNFVQISKSMGSIIQLSYCGEAGQISIITINPFSTKDEVEKSIYTWILSW